MSRRRLIDGVCVVLVVCAAYLVGVWTVEDAAAAGIQPMFYQSSFAPAVMLACGYGYHNVSGTDNPALMGFLLQQRDRFDCVNASPAARPVALDSFQGISRYFESAVALVWRWRGVRWSALLPLFGLMVVASAIATYGLLRVVSPPIVALIGTLVAAFSPMALANLPNLRDYAKAPFVLGLLWIFAAVLRRPRSGRAFVALAAAAAVLESVGLGFRTDLWLLLPLIAVVFATARVQGDSATRSRLTAAACFLVLFGAIAWPVLRGYTRGSNTAHVVLLGFAAPFDAPLDVQPASYTLGSFYNDSYMYARVAAFSRVLGMAKPPYIGTPEYDRVSGDYLGELIRMFPGDVATRAIASFMGVLRSPFEAHAADLAYIRAPLRRAFAVRDWIIGMVGEPLKIAIAAVVVGAVVLDPWPSIVGLMVFLVISSAAMLQFHPRHFFYVEVLVWLPVCAAMANVGRLRRLDLRRIRRSGVITAIVVFVGGPAAAAGAVHVARSIQHRHTDAWLTKLRSVARVPLPVRTESISPDRVRLVLPALSQDDSHDALALSHVVAGRYAMVIGGASCDRVNVPLTIRYRSTVPFDDFTEQDTVPLPLAGGEVTLYQSVFEFDTPTYTGDAHLSLLQTRFAGIETDTASARCIERIDAIPEESWPQPVTSVMEAPGASWHERLEWERSPDTPIHVVTLPAEMSRTAIQRALAAPLDERRSFTAAAVHVTGKALRVDGRVEGPFTYLVTLPDRSAAAGDLAVIAGELASGGLTIGFQQHGAWAESVNVTRPGPFVVALAPPAPGEYQVVVANCLPDRLNANHVSISRVGWASR